MQPHTGSRVFGLDLMRAVAILLVLRSHADDLLDAYWPADPGMAALDGVDVFFVLSGFLIGGILLRMSEAVEMAWGRRLIDFWQRRWLRTLPNYFLFLLINIILVHSGLAPGLLNENTLAYFVFLQNFIIPLDLFFWESWSLAVEEWFYLLFPILLFILIGALKRPVRSAFLIGVGLMIIIPTVLRFSAVEAAGTPFMLDLLVRKIVVLRLDTIGFGVLMAWFAHVLPAHFHARRFELFAIGVIGLTTSILLRSDTNLTYMGTWFFTVSGMSMALMLPVVAGWKRTGRWGSGVAFLSLISYALYLVHMPVRHLFMPLLVGRSLSLSIGLYAAYWIVCLILAALVFRYWERPFMDLRQRFSRRILEVPSSSS